MLRLRLEYDDLCLIRLSWQWMTERCRGRIWVICLSPARYSAIRWTHQTLVRAAISFVEKRSSFFTDLRYRPRAMGMLDTTVVPTPRYTLCLAPA